MADLRGSALTDADYETLARSWIDRAHAEKAMLRRVTSIEGAELVGQSDGHDYAGIVFPYFWPGETHAREYRLRRDSPDFTYEKGVRKPHRKYLSPPGRGNLLYFVPGTSAELLEDVELPIIITEGEKKAIALCRLAWHGLSDASERPRFLTGALSGVWNFRGTVGKENGPNGERVDVKDVIADFNRIRWAGRKVIIAYDSDTRTNEKVRAARFELARHLIHERGARVYFLEVPSESSEQKVGIDDLLATVGPDKVLKLIERAKQANVKQRTPPQTAVLTRMLAEVEFFHTQDMRPFATFEVNGHRETWPTRSQGFRNWLSRKFYLEENKPPSAQALQEALAICDARSQFDGEVCEVGVRVLGHGPNIYVDLANDSWQAIEIKPSGWRVVSDQPVRFRRARGMASLPVPISGSISDLRRFVNAGTEENWILMTAWLVAALNPSGPFPVLVLQGEQGTGKSTVARVLRLLADPSTAALRSVPREERDLMIAASNSWVISLDNLSGIPQWLSDALCRLATGGGFATRELHTDSEEILFDATRPIILNGIDDIAGNPDLADRALIVTLPQVAEENRIPEKIFWKQFSEALPGILGALLDAVSMALQNLEQVRVPRLPRMADFARWICAAAPALPFTQEAFLEAYSDNRRESVSLSIEASSVAASMQALTATDNWEGTATELLKALNGIASEDTKKGRAWPKDARTLSGKVRRIAPLLRQVGLDVTFRTEGHQKMKKITLTRRLPRTSDRSDRVEVGSNGSTALGAGYGAYPPQSSSDRCEQRAAATTPDLRPLE